VKRVLAALMLVAALLPAGVSRSGATFVAATANPGASFTAAPDFNTVAVSLANPGSPLRGSVLVSATAASDRGIASVVLQSAPAGTSNWTTACTKTVAPYTCTFDTSAVADGLRDIRAVATDTAGYSRTDTVSNRRVDNTAPSPTTTDPGSPLTGTVSVTSSATETGSGLASHTLQYRATAGAWTDICTTAIASMTCSWDTSGLADGLYDLRTVATDVAGNSATSAPVFNRRVDNNAPTVTMTDPGSPLRNTVTLQSSSTDGLGSGVASVRYEYKPSAGSTWSTACTAAGSPSTCSFNTSSVGDGLYDFRAVATDGVGNPGTSAAVTSRRIDNTPPGSAVLLPLPSPLQGTVAMAATAVDLGSGIADVKVQYAPAGTTSWTTICTATAALPTYTCSFASTGVADASYDFRVLATDDAGNTLASATQTRIVDNNGPTVTNISPAAGASVGGTINVSATATDISNVASVQMQYRRTGTALWTTLCTDTASPYVCPLNTTGLVNGGSYELRFVATDAVAHVTTTPATAFTVDNTAPTAVDVQATNGGTAGTLDAGDALTFTFSEPMLPSSILAGWDGSAIAVTARIGESTTNDRFELYDAANTTRTNLTAAGSPLNLSADYVATNATYNATMQRVGNTITVTFGAQTSGTSRTGARKGKMAWTPAAAATDLGGNAMSGATINETGGSSDTEF
jgi:Bacterial Ig domain/Bacterial Ig-like domain (group 3)